MLVFLAAFNVLTNITAYHLPLLLSMCSYCLPNPHFFCKIHCSSVVQCYLCALVKYLVNRIAYDESTAWFRVQHFLKPPQPHITCKLGGYTSMRHNLVRDSEAQIMRKVCRDVQTKPTLLPINENDYERKVNTADNARLDISARGRWNRCEKTFFDIRITHPTSPITVLFCEVPSRDLPKT